MLQLDTVYTVLFSISWCSSSIYQLLYCRSAHCDRYECAPARSMSAQSIEIDFRLTHWNVICVGVRAGGNSTVRIPVRIDHSPQQGQAWWQWWVRVRGLYCRGHGASVSGPSLGCILKGCLPLHIHERYHRPWRLVRLGPTLKARVRKKLCQHSPNP